MSYGAVRFSYGTYDFRTVHMIFIRFSCVATRGAMRPSGCKILPHGAPLHPEHIFTSFGGLWKHSVLFGMSTAGGVSTKIVRPSRYEILCGAVLVLGAARAHAECPPKGPQSTTGTK